MTNSERFEKAINWQQIDRILTYDFVVSEKLLAKYGGYEKANKYSFEQLVEINAKTFKAIGLDVARHIYDPTKSWMGSKIENWVRFLGVKRDGWGVTEKEGTDGSTSLTTGWITKRPFSGLKELEKHIPSVPKYEEVEKWYKPMIKLIKEVFDEYGLVFIGAVDGPVNDSYIYTGMELFMTAIGDGPELVSQIMDCTAKLSAYIAKVFADLSGVAPAKTENASAPGASHAAQMLFMGEDIAGAAGPIFNPIFIIKEALPRWRWISEPIKNKGFKLLFHSDGRYGELMPIIFDEFEADGLEPIERNGCNDIFEIRKQYPDKLLFGNVCCAVTLPMGNIYDVEDETLELIERIGPSGGILIGSSGGIDDYIPPENVLIMYKTVHKYGTYPINIDRIRKRRSEIRGNLKTRKTE
ncbi:MAG: hypothetical protein JW947_03910 [Sedimentisphaerales bacterium]|nr:hypothetical protein [Sedimentisphaerales bacterium]